MQNPTPSNKQTVQFRSLHFYCFVVMPLDLLRVSVHVLFFSSFYYNRQLQRLHFLLQLKFPEFVLISNLSLYFQLMVTGDNGVFGFPVHIPVVEDPVEGHVSVTRPSLSMGVNIVKDEIYRLITVTQNPAQVIGYFLRPRHICPAFRFHSISYISLEQIDSNLSGLSIFFKSTNTSLFAGGTCFFY